MKYLRKIFEDYKPGMAKTDIAKKIAKKHGLKFIDLKVSKVRDDKDYFEIYEISDLNDEQTGAMTFLSDDECTELMKNGLVYYKHKPGEGPGIHCYKEKDSKTIEEWLEITRAAGKFGI